MPACRKNTTMKAGPLAIVLAAGFVFTPASPAAAQPDVFSVNRQVRFTEPTEVRVHLTISADASCAGNIQALGLKETFPKGWAYSGLYGEYYGEEALALGSGNSAGTKSVLVTPWKESVDFYWIEVPPFPVTLVYGLMVSALDPEDVISGMLFVFTQSEEIDFPSPETRAGDMVCLASTRDPGGLVYVPGQDVTVRLQIDNFCGGAMTGLQATEIWDIPVTLASIEITYPEYGGISPEVQLPELGIGSPFVFNWLTQPVFPLVIEYALHVPMSVSGPVQITGEALYMQGGELTAAPLPTQYLYGDNPDRLHPADADRDWRIEISEAVYYISGWQQGIEPMAYAIRAAYLWQAGEYYRYVDTAAPRCWESRTRL